MNASGFREANENLSFSAADPKARPLKPHCVARVSGPSNREQFGTRRVLVRYRERCSRACCAAVDPPEIIEPCLYAFVTPVPEHANEVGRGIGAGNIIVETGDTAGSSQIDFCVLRATIGVVGPEMFDADHVIGA